MGDHYDPISKTVRLTEDKMNSGSLTSIVVAAHEVGHAHQDSTKYFPLSLRTKLVKLFAYYKEWAPLFSWQRHS